MSASSSDSLTVRASGSTVPERFRALSPFVSCSESDCAKKIDAWYETKPVAYKDCLTLNTWKIELLEFGANLELARTTQDAKQKKAAQKLARTFAETIQGKVSFTSGVGFWILSKLSFIFGMTLANKIEKKMIEFGALLNSTFTTDEKTHEDREVEDAVQAYIRSRSTRALDEREVRLSMKYVIRQRGNKIYQYLQDEIFFQRIDRILEVIAVEVEKNGNSVFDERDLYARIFAVEIEIESIVADDHEIYFSSDQKRQELRELVHAQLLANKYGVWCRLRADLKALPGVIEELRKISNKTTVQEIERRLPSYKMFRKEESL